VLDGVNLVVGRGQRAALIGLTGSGKTTFIGLIPRMYDVDTGRICIDGSDIRTKHACVAPPSDRHMVLQDTVLFHASVAQNIAYGRPGATRDEIVRAAQLANAVSSSRGCQKATTQSSGNGATRCRVAVAV
jgi:ABC-type multidrug transport system fused ATPase/permease subunit